MKKGVQSHIINSLLTSFVRSVHETIGPRVVSHKLRCFVPRFLRKPQPNIFPYRPHTRLISNQYIIIYNIIAKCLKVWCIHNVQRNIHINMLNITGQYIKYINKSALLSLLHTKHAQYLLLLHSKHPQKVIFSVLASYLYFIALDMFQKFLRVTFSTTLLSQILYFTIFHILSFL